MFLNIYKLTIIIWIFIRILGFRQLFSLHISEFPGDSLIKTKKKKQCHKIYSFSFTFLISSLTLFYIVYVNNLDTALSPAVYRFLYIWKFGTTNRELKQRFSSYKRALIWFYVQNYKMHFCFTTSEMTKCCPLENLTESLHMLFSESTSVNQS